jgi:TetR/AcrR family transcriptional regulator, transcriptional repressor for nem operon
MPQKSVKEQIVTAAVETLHMNGFNATGVQGIAAAAGVPKGSLFNHFENKEALGLEALDRYWQAGLEWLGILDNPRVPPLKRLKTYFRGLTQAVEKRNYDAGCMIGNLALEMSASSRPIRERLAAVFAAWSRGIETCVREAQADGSMRRDLNAKNVANLLLNSWQGAAMRAKVNKDSSSFAEFETVFKALTP